MLFNLWQLVMVHWVFVPVFLVDFRTFQFASWPMGCPGRPGPYLWYSGLGFRFSSLLTMSTTPVLLSILCDLSMSKMLASSDFKTRLRLTHKVLQVSTLSTLVNYRTLLPGETSVAVVGCLSHLGAELKTSFLIFALLFTWTFILTLKYTCLSPLPLFRFVGVILKMSGRLWVCVIQVSLLPFLVISTCPPLRFSALFIPFPSEVIAWFRGCEQDKYSG